MNTTPKNAPLNSLAVTLMTSWYEKHSDYPYVDYDTAEAIARAGGITPEQVRKWFANKRVRSGYTKSQVKKRRHSFVETSPQKRCNDYTSLSDGASPAKFRKR